jgi:hypothetical protein
LVLGDAAADNLETARKKEGHEFKIQKVVIWFVVFGFRFVKLFFFQLQEEADRTKETYVELNTKLGQGKNCVFLLFVNIFW